jgi:hypothetical protein
MNKALLFFFLIFNYTIAQEIVLEKTALISRNNIKGGTVNYIDNGAISSINYVKGQEMASWSFTKNFDLIDELKTKKETKNCINFLGSFNDQTHTVFMFSNKNKKKFRAIVINKDSKQTKDLQLGFKLKKEALISAFTYNSEYYLLTFSKSTLRYNLHIIDTKLQHRIQNLDIRSGSYSIDGHTKTLQRNEWSYSFFNIGSDLLNNVRFIEDDISYFNATTTKPVKIYLKYETLFLSLDTDNNHTSIIEINLNSFTTKAKQFSKKHFGANIDYLTKSNSFLYKGQLFSIKGNEDTINLRIYDLKQNTLLSELEFDQKTPYYLDDNLLVTEDIVSQFNLTKAKKPQYNSIKKRLHQIMRGENRIGLSICNMKDQYQIVIGGYYSTQALSSYGLTTTNSSNPFLRSNNGITYIYDASLNLYLDKTNHTLRYNDSKHPYLLMDNFLFDTFGDDFTSFIKGIKKFEKNNTYYLSYFNTNSNTFYIRKF